MSSFNQELQSVLLFVSTTAVLLVGANPAIAGCSTSSPHNDELVVCDTSDPNPDPHGVIASDATGVTLEIRDGAGIATSDAPAVALGGNASIIIYPNTTASGPAAIETSGDASPALLLNLGNEETADVTVNGATISSNGVGSSLIAIDAAGERSAGILITDSVLTAAGDGAAGIRVTGPAVDVDGTDDTLVFTNVMLQTEGDDAPAVSLGPLGLQADRTVTVLRSSLTTDGEGSAGVSVGPHGDFADVVFGMSGTRVQTMGPNSPAIVLGGTGACCGSAPDGGTLQSVFVATNLLTDGDNSTGLQIGGAGPGAPLDHSMANLNIVTEGHGSRGLVLEALSPEALPSLGMADVTIKTTGNNSGGLTIGSGYGSGPVIDFPNGIGQTGAKLEDVEVETRGEGSHALVLEERTAFTTDPNRVDTQTADGQFVSGHIDNLSTFVAIGPASRSVIGQGTLLGGFDIEGDLELGGLLDLTLFGDERDDIVNVSGSLFAPTTGFDLNVTFADDFSPKDGSLIDLIRTGDTHAFDTSLVSLAIFNGPSNKSFDLLFDNNALSLAVGGEDIAPIPLPGTAPLLLAGLGLLALRRRGAGKT